MQPSKNWNLMATHGIVLFYIAANPDSTMRQMSEALSLTDAVSRRWCATWRTRSCST